MVQEVWKFEFHQSVFKKVTQAGLNSLRQKRYQISVKNWPFDDPFHKKGLVLNSHLGARDDPTIRLNIIFDEMRLPRSLRPLRLLRLQRSMMLHRFYGLEITTEDFSVIQVLEFVFTLMFRKTKCFGRIMKYHVEFQHPFWRRLLRPAFITFLKTGL